MVEERGETPAGTLKWGTQDELETAVSACLKTVDLVEAADGIEAVVAAAGAEETANSAAWSSQRP